MFEPLSRHELISLAVSLVCGLALGIEREYRNKSTGIRTLVLICLGSTLFSLVSRHGTGSDDRIAANIITGIGFIGAGVIFKDRLSVLGLTTAAVIWMTAAIGMAAGAGLHSLSTAATAGVLVVLGLLYPVERWVHRLPQSRIITVTFLVNTPQPAAVLVTLCGRCGLRGRVVQQSKKDGCALLVLKVTGRPAALQQLNIAMLELEAVKEFS